MFEFSVLIMFALRLKTLLPEALTFMLASWFSSVVSFSPLGEDIYSVICIANGFSNLYKLKCMEGVVLSLIDHGGRMI